MASGRVEVGGRPAEDREETGLTPDRSYSADIPEQFYEVGQNRINLVPVVLGASWTPTRR